MPTDRAIAKQTVATYAEALYQAAESDGVIDVIGGQLADALIAVTGSAELRDALRDEALPAQSRRAVAEGVFAQQQPALVSVLALMAERGDARLMWNMAEAYGDIAEKRRDIVAVEVTTVVPLTDGLRSSVTAKLEADFGKRVTLREKIDPAIIGGIIISAHGRRIDASLLSQLDHAREALSTAHTGGEV